jgi:uncharacterized protein YbcI
MTETTVEKHDRLLKATAKGMDKSLKKIFIKEIERGVGKPVTDPLDKQLITSIAEDILSQTNNTELTQEQKLFMINTTIKATIKDIKDHDNGRMELS